jgi:hypothetical protein
MSYRSGPCSFCDDEACAQCPRCGASTCTAHAPGSESESDRAAGHSAHCAICAKELKDDLDEIAFIRDLGEPGDDRGMFARRPSLADWVESLVRSVGRAHDIRRAKKVFGGRTAGDIAAWRRRAGITVRGQ